MILRFDYRRSESTSSIPTGMVGVTISELKPSVTEGLPDQFQLAQWYSTSWDTDMIMEIDESLRRLRETGIISFRTYTLILEELISLRRNVVPDELIRQLTFDVLN